MRQRNIAVLASAATLTGWSVFAVSMPSAAAQACPDVEVVFARGTNEAPGPGPTGQAFVDALRAQVGVKSMAVYPVNYPASTDFHTALTGINDASTRVLATAATCPDTKMVLGGFSQGAAVAGFVTANVIPDGAPQGAPNPLPPDVAKHVAAVALFGKPNDRFMHAINQPRIAIGPLYADKTIELCVPNDLVCSSGRDFNAHQLYAETGMVDQAATFAASRVLAVDDPAEQPPSAGPGELPPSSVAAAPPATAVPHAPPLSTVPAAPAQPPGPPPGPTLQCDSNCPTVGPA